MGLKEDYLAKMEAQIREWGEKINELKDKADKATADLKAKMYQEMDELRAKNEAAQQKLEEIRTAGAGKWEALKENYEKAWEEGKKKWESIKSKYF